MRKVKLSNGGIPGVFNCRFANPTVVNPNRKKKKPTTFVPPPPQSQTGTMMGSVTMVGDSKQWLNVANSSRQLIPFWKKPLSSSSITQVGIERVYYQSRLTTTVATTLFTSVVERQLQRAEG